MKKEDLKKELYDLLKAQLVCVGDLKCLSIDELNLKIAPRSWSILECIAHLNLYFDFYIPEIQKSLSNHKKSNKSNFRSGIIGSYFVNIIKPTSSNKPMKTSNEMNPVGSNLDIDEFLKFEKNMIKVIELLNLSISYNWNTVKTKVSISKYVKIRIGDTFRFIVYHNERHFKQIENILRTIKS